MKFRQSKTLFLMFVVIISLSSMLSACGKTGDLYLPDEEESSEEKN